MVIQTKQINLNSLVEGSALQQKAKEFKSGFNMVFNVPDKVVENNNKSVPEPENIEDRKLYTQTDLSDSRNKGYEEGYAKGYSNAKVESDDLNKKIAESIKAIEEKLASMISENRLADAKNERNVAELVIHIANKVANKAMKNNPLEEVEEVIKKSLKLLFDEQKIIISVNKKVAKKIKEKMDSLVKKEGFQGQVELKESDSLGIADCSIDWQGGGITSDKEMMWNEIDKLCSDLL